MFAQFEINYASLIMQVLAEGERRMTRNYETKAIFGTSLVIDMEGTNWFPLIQGRKSHYKGVMGEFAALVRGPSKLAHFEQWGCNYWGKWADEDGSLTVDYGNEWLRNGQVDHLKHCLEFNPTDRRMIINGWNPANLEQLSLPCCHYNYQFFVRNGEFIDMIWTQRSVDIMIGLPADIVLAYTWLVMLANEFGYKPGRITMNFGDTHIYADHITNAMLYCERVLNGIVGSMTAPTYTLTCEPGKDFLQFEPCDILINDYVSLSHLEFNLHA